jgi:hypothetical protein
MKIKGWKILAISGLVALGATIITTTSVIVHLSDKYITFGPYKLLQSDIFHASKDSQTEDIRIDLIQGKIIYVDPSQSYYLECDQKLHKLGWF